MQFGEKANNEAKGRYTHLNLQCHVGIQVLVGRGDGQQR